MSACRLAVITCDSAHSRLMAVPGTLAELFTLLERTFCVQRSRITVLQQKATPTELLDEQSYQCALSDPTETLTLQVFQKRQSLVPSSNYVLSFSSRHCLQALKLDDDSCSAWDSQHLDWTGRACVLAEDRLIFTGGSCTPLAAYQYDVATGLESRLADMGVGRIWHGVCCLGEVVFAVGGRPALSSAPQSSAEMFTTGVWSELPELNVPRESMALVANQEEIFAFGGFDGTKRLASIESFDGEQWTLLSCEIPAPRQMPGVVFIDESTVVVAGGQDAKCARTEVFELHLDTGRWEEKDPLPQAAYFTGRQLVVRDSGRLWAFGTHTYVREADKWTLRS